MSAPDHSATFPRQYILTCPTCLDHGIYGDADETTGDVVDTYCACLHGQARRARDEG